MVSMLVCLLPITPTKNSVAIVGAKKTNAPVSNVISRNPALKRSAAPPLRSAQARRLGKFHLPTSVMILTPMLGKR
jgi:hypothetical protein